MILIILVLLLFSIILLYHLCTNTPLIEPNDADDTADNLATNESSVAVTLAEKNGRDISILQSKIEEINNLKIQVKKNSEQVRANDNALSRIGKEVNKLHHSDYADELSNEEESSTQESFDNTSSMKKLYKFSSY